MTQCRSFRPQVLLVPKTYWKVLRFAFTHGPSPHKTPDLSRDFVVKGPERGLTLADPRPSRLIPSRLWVLRFRWTVRDSRPWSDGTSFGPTGPRSAVGGVGSGSDESRRSRVGRESQCGRRGVGGKTDRPLLPSLTPPTPTPVRFRLSARCLVSPL